MLDNKTLNAVIKYWIDLNPSKQIASSFFEVITVLKAEKYYESYIFCASLIESCLVWQQFLTRLGFSSYSLRLTRQLQKRQDLFSGENPATD
jgi:hypothetical protein